MFLSKCQKMSITLLTRYFLILYKRGVPLLWKPLGLSEREWKHEPRPPSHEWQHDGRSQFPPCSWAARTGQPSGEEPPGLSSIHVFTTSQDAPLEAAWWISLSLVFNLWFQAKKWYPWRSFIAIHGSHPLIIWDVSPIEHYMQVCCFMNTCLRLPLPHWGSGSCNVMFL